MEGLLSGGLLGDDLVVSIIRDRVGQENYQDGFILDGFAQTVKREEMLDAVLVNDRACCVNMYPICEERIRSRRIHKSVGRFHHAKFASPSTPTPKSLGEADLPTVENMLDGQT